jgi:hypothetical protein
LPFETTEQFQPLDGTVGQERGVAALEFGLEMESPGLVGLRWNKVGLITTNHYRAEI